MSNRRYKDAQITRMIINPYHEEQNIYAAYPQLKEVIEPFAEKLPDINYHQYFRYLSLCYDPQSPAISEYPDLRKRKDIASAETGYEGQLYPLIAINFLKTIVKSRDWWYICTLENNYSEYIDILNTPIIIDDQNDLLKTLEIKGKLRSQANDMRVQLPNLYADFYADKELEEEDKIVNYSSAESVAKEIKGRKK